VKISDKVLNVDEGAELKRNFIIQIRVDGNQSRKIRGRGCWQ
jgi:hypothetical protein